MTSKKVLRTTLAAVSVATMTVLATPGVAFGVDGEDGTPASSAVVVADEVGAAGKVADLTGIPATASLTVHKRTPSTADETPEANGTAINSEATKLPGAKPIGGVTFTLYKVDGIDLTKNEGWRQANDLVDAWKNLSDAKKESITELGGKTITKQADAAGTTGDNGDVTIENVPAGLYVVRETIDGATVKIDQQDKPAGSVVKAAPFIVALPMTNPSDRTKWMKNVHVYPKNSTSGVQKEVKDAGTRGLGNTEGNKEESEVTYTIKADVPVGFQKPLSQENQDTADKNARRFRNFQVIDVFHEKVNYNASDVVSLGVLDEKGAVTDLEELTAPEDYAIEVNPSGKTPDGTNANHIDKAVVTLTDKGLAKMADYAIAKRAKNKAEKVVVVWELKAVFDAATTDKTELTNDTYVIPDYPNGSDSPWTPDQEVPPNVPTAKVVSKYGTVEINKFAKDTGDRLNGAKFKLWVCDVDGNKLNLDGTTPANGDTPKSVRVNNVDEWETAGDGEDAGKIKIQGLRLNDWKNDTSEKEAVIPEEDRDYYCLEETEAPEGYEKLPNMIKFQLLTTDSNFKKSLDIKNVPANGGFDLPLTGGKGVFPLIALGGLLVVGSAGYAAAASRRKRAEA